MKLMVKKSLIAVTTAMVVMSTPTWADEQQLTERIERLERIIKGQGLMSLLGRVDQLQNEVQRLNGDNEALRHELEQMQRRQREMYIDLDQRIGTGAVSSAPVTPANDIDQQAVTVIDPPADTQTVDSPQSEEPNVEQPDLSATTTEEQTTEVEPAPVAVESGEAAYQSALQSLRSGEYEKAIAALSAFPESYPQSTYLPNTYYWKGEAYYVLRQFDEAISSFQTVLDKFPASSKVPDATLKLGFSLYELGQVEAAKETLSNVMTLYPNTSAARLAKVRFDRIK
jgi:tol-pal system protein YbgF